MSTIFQSAGSRMVSGPYGESHPDPLTKSRSSSSELPDDSSTSHRRPQSLIAQDFSLSLDNIFHLNEDIISINNDIDRKRHSVSLQAQELKALEAQLREMDERLRTFGIIPPPPPQVSPLEKLLGPHASLAALDNFVFPSTSSTSFPQSTQGGKRIPGSSSVSSSSSGLLSPIDTDRVSSPNEKRRTGNNSGESLEAAEEEKEDYEDDDDGDEAEDEYELIRRPRKRSIIPTLRAAEAKRVAERDAVSSVTTKG